MSPKRKVLLFLFLSSQDYLILLVSLVSSDVREGSVFVFSDAESCAIYRIPFWERLLFCPTLCQACCCEDKSTQETPPCRLIGYEGWDSLIGWQLPLNRMLPGSGGKKGKGGRGACSAIQETTTGCPRQVASCQRIHTRSLRWESCSPAPETFYSEK